MREPLRLVLLRFLVRLFPGSFRERHGASILEAARTAARAGGGGASRPILADAVATLARTWLDVGREAARGVRPVRALTAAGRDAGVALRGLRRRPLDGVVVVLTLAVALGANVAIFSVTHALLVETLPYADPERIMEVRSPPLSMVQAGDALSWQVGSSLREHPGVEAAATYYPEAGANLVEGSHASRVRITQVSSAFFRVLGVRMLLGPGLVEEPEAGDRAVLGYDLWRTAFGGDSAMVGRTIRLSGRGYVVAGVAPQDVSFPAGTQLWLTDPPVAEFYGGAYGPSVIARLVPGAGGGVEAAMAEYASAERVRAGPEYAERIRDPSLVPLRDVLVEPVELPLLVLSVAAALVLLLGCVNVAGVTLARLASRGQELVMRRALGASRCRIFGQLMTELGALALIAGGLSAGMAVGLIPLLVGMLPAGTPRLEAAMHPGPTLWLLAAAGTVLVALVAGLPPAIAAARRTAGGGHPDRVRGDDVLRQRGQGLLAATQIALAVPLVVAASLFAHTLAELRAVPLGYDTSRVMTFEVSLPEASYDTPAAARQYLDDVLSRIRAVPGVESAGAIDRPPLSETMGIGLYVNRLDAPAEAAITAGYRRATSELFDALDIRFQSGRTFSTSPDEAILSRDLARRLFGDTDPISRSIRIGRSPRTWDATVVGVVDDVRFGGAATEIQPAFYQNLAPSPRGRFSIAVRTAGEAAPLAPALRRVLGEVDPRVPPFRMRTTREAAHEVIAARQAVARISVLFGAAALSLALLAVYGMLAQAVALRRHELGVRLALGAPIRSIERLVVRRGLAWTAAGVAAGLLLSINVVRLTEGMLFGVAPRDPRILAATTAAVLLSALVASWLPARRAGRTDPLATLRSN